MTESEIWNLLHAPERAVPEHLQHVADASAETLIREVSRDFLSVYYLSDDDTWGVTTNFALRERVNTHGRPLRPAQNVILCIAPNPGAALAAYRYAHQKIQPVAPASVTDIQAMRAVIQQLRPE